MMKWLKIGISALYCFAIIYVVDSIVNVSWLVVSGLFLPVCLWIIILLHELSHWLCFKLFGFRVRELRIGLFLINCVETTKKIKIVDSGFFRGFCIVDRKTKNGNVKLILSLMAGGVSGLLTSVISFSILILNIVTGKWRGFYVNVI